MQFKTINFLPKVFQSETNNKFLTATLDQLISEPDFLKVNGYIGRKFAPMYKKTDNYLTEQTQNRSNYQLEPGTVVFDTNGKIQTYVSFIDLIDKINFYGGLTNDQDRLFSGEYYTFNGLVDFDKLVNFTQYRWCPSGPELVILHGINIVPTDVMGKVTYTTPPSTDPTYPGLSNGVVFSSGMRVQFMDYTNINNPVPAGIYYVEGVGKSIRLVAESDLTVAELSPTYDPSLFDEFGYDVDNFEALASLLSEPDYITINRSSLDQSPWSRSNRWVHESILISSAAYNNNTGPIFNTTQAYIAIRGQRPIIEFIPDLLLFNYGRIGCVQVDYADTITTHALHSPNSDINIALVNRSADGKTIVFLNDTDETVRNKIFTISITGNIVTYVQNQGEFVSYNSISAIDTIVNTITGNSIVSFVTGYNFWYNNTTWKQAQSKTTVNTAPLFDVLLSDKNSISTIDTAWKGSQLFGYSISSTAPIDKILGLRVKYKKFNLIGDLEFSNYYDIDTFEKNGVPTNVSTGNFYKILPNGDLFKESAWKKVSDYTRQWQLFTYNSDGSSQLLIDVLPSDVGYDIVTPTSSNNYHLYINAVPSDMTVMFSIENNQILATLSGKVAIGDKVELSLYSTEASKHGFYQIPVNLNDNAINESFTQATVGQMRDHFFTVAQNTPGVTGDLLGANNTRDLDYSFNAGSILLHRAPLIYSQLFLVDNTVNFVDSAILAQREYTKFKNKFLLIAEKTQMAPINTVPEAVDQIIAQINAPKNNTSPWFYSDMVPYGTTYSSSLDYVVNDPDLTGYEFSTVYNDTILSNKSVLVYLNGTQLVKGRDYTFRTDIAVVVFSIALSYGDKIRITEYSNTDGCYMPETPTKLGLYPKYVPQIILDTSYRTPTSVIIGHDGSSTPVYGDYRDQLLLELELRIYNNLKVQHGRTMADIAAVVPGKFRKTAYNKTEFDTIMAAQFMRWVGNSKLNYTDNPNYQVTDKWSWNYNRHVDKLSGEKLPGFWRGIYNYFYDTDTPNLTPWLMLGMSEKPVWWEAEYGLAPYTGGNINLWDDIETGTIRGGADAGVYPTLARPGMTTIIPVDKQGNLRAPADFLVTDPRESYTTDSFIFGDNGPVEAAWRRSSDYAFALQVANALAKPAEFFGSYINIEHFVYDPMLDMVVDSNGKLLAPTNILIHGEQINGVTTRNAGYLNWISDNLRNNGVDGQTKLRAYFDSIDIRLGYMVGGYTDKSYIEVFAEQHSPSSVNDSISVPNENYKIFLRKSPPIQKSVYSAVIVEKTVTGFQIRGYNTNNPFFTIYPSIVNSNNYVLKALGAAGVIYNNGYDKPIDIPYGTEFTTNQQVTDFLVGYQRYLISIGFIFDRWNSDLGMNQDWTLSVMEFLTWTQQGWNEGALLVLSPIESSIEFTPGPYTIDAITNSTSGSRILDQHFVAIKSANLSVVRDTSLFTISTNTTIAYVELHLVQYEHCMVFDNTTLFNDIIYYPALGNRQYRLKLIGAKTNGWAGALNPSGFIYNADDVSQWQMNTDYLNGDLVQFKNNYYTANGDVIASIKFDFSQWTFVPAQNIKFGLLQNYSLNAQKFEEFYDVDSVGLDGETNAYAKGLVGFRRRDYLTNLGLDVATQLKFYQGFIKEKGTANAARGLRNLGDNIDITMFEEWALKVGEYGGISSEQFVETIVDPAKYTTDPATIEFVDTALIYKASESWGMVPTPFLANRDELSHIENDIPTAGYVRDIDVGATIFDMANYVSLNDHITALHNGFKIWTVRDFTRNWNIYSLLGKSQNIILEYVDATTITMTTTSPHGLSNGDIFALTGASDTQDSFMMVSSIISDTKLSAKTGKDATQLQGDNALISDTAIVYTLLSVRFATQSTLADSTHLWSIGDKVWVDSATHSPSWGVYEKRDPWALPTSLQYISSSIINENFGYAVAADKNDVNYYAIGAPGSGTVTVYSGMPAAQYILTGGPSFGTSIAMSDTQIIIGEPLSGKVYVYNRNSGAVPTIQFTLTQPSDFGTAVTISNDSQRLFVTAPTTNTVYYYNGSVLVGTASINNVSSSNEAIKTTGDGTVLVVGGVGNTIVYTIDSNMTIKATLSPVVPDSQFGEAVEISADGSFIFVSSPAYQNSAYIRGAVFCWENVAGTYTPTQTITHPGGVYSGAQTFGTVIRYNTTTNALAISSIDAAQIEHLIFDTKTTTFDLNSTVFSDTISSVGAVYMFEKLGNQFGFIQSLENLHGLAGDEYGRSIAYSGNMLLIGAPDNDILASNAGTVYFYKAAEATGWLPVLTANEKVDITRLNRVYLYDKKTAAIVANLDYIDPAKGKILGIAEDDIDIKTAYDPAHYNSGTGTISISPWTEAAVGKIWWDMNLLAVTEYEQGDLDYRAANWGKYFPGTQIAVYQWIESTVLPSVYTESGFAGTPKDVSDGAYSVGYTVDILTGAVKDKYYFWVSGLDTPVAGKHTSINNIARMISNPRASGVPFAAFTKNDAVALYGVKSYLNDVNTVLHIGYSAEKTSEKTPIHHEYALVQENNEKSIFPAKFVTKLYDSLIGFNDRNAQVPDQSLRDTEKYGIGVRPQQTLFVDRIAAGNVMLSFVNKVLATYPAIEEHDASALYTLPSTVLSFIDWYAPGYTASSKFTYVVNNSSDIVSLTLTEGDTVYVKNANSNQFEIFKIDSNLHRITIGMQNGTFMLLPALFNDPASYRTLLLTLEYNIFIGKDSIQFNEMMFALIHYALTEQKNTDWIFKTSFVSVLHSIDSLQQFPTYQTDNMEYYAAYLNEVKPYRTVIREYVTNNVGIENLNIDVADFIPGATSLDNPVIQRFTNMTIKFDRVSYVDNLLALGITPNYDALSFGSTPFDSFDSDSLLGNISLLTAADRIALFYNPTPDMPGKDTILLSGLDYDLVSILPLSFTDTGAVDTIITSDFTTPDENIIVNGAGFLDVYHSPAPEELVPGTVTDSISISVYTKWNATTFTGYRLTINNNNEVTYTRIADGATIPGGLTTHAYDLESDMNAFAFIGEINIDPMLIP